ncbi:Fanconi anemia group B protein [Pimephales promelas]|uniref:Fanconi anemia group B protein n=1 Tax=Pimephales promelas TaxID=90988 RepID=UPI001955CEC5|nr:Fanconi anemia group B protein [Pimephales promelas]KAG1927831.1 Fanconi anemia group B protein [Pimephales promelas]
MAAERFVSMLAFGGEVLAFQCSKPRDHRKGSEVSSLRLSFDQTLQTFSVTDRNTHPIHRESSSETLVVHCASAFDAQLRQKVPCVLLRICKKRTSAFKYVLYSAGGKLHVEFALPYEIRDHISILEGPTLIWSHESSVFYASSQSGVKEVPIPFHSIKFIGELPLHKRKLVIHGTTNDAKNTLYFIDDAERVDGACFVPNAYVSVLQCMLVLSAEEDGGSFKSRVLAATSTKQLVRFEDGSPRDVCALPYEHPRSVRTVHTPRNERLVVVSFGQGNVCAVWSDTFQVAWCVTGVCVLLVDDFLRCGSDQMLLVFEDQDSPGDLLRNFTLTDLCGVTYSCGRSDGAVPNTSDSAPDNFLLTVQALESRLQSGMNFLEDLQRDVEVKDRLILQSLVALTDLVSGREHVIVPPEQEGLVSLWDDDEDEDAGDEEPDVLDDRIDTECAEAHLEVDRVWQRVFGQSLIVGVVLKPTNNTSVMNMSVSVVDSGSALVINTKILPFPESDVCVALGPFDEEKNIRRSDRPASTLALVAVTDLAPLLTSGCVKCPIMLHYSTRESSGSSRVSQFCGKISVDLKDISMGKFHLRLLQDSKLNTDEAREDLLSLTALLDSWLFLIECPDHTLADVQGFIHESLYVSVLDVDPRIIADPTDLRLFHWDQRSPFQALLSIQCMDDLCLLQFLHSLCDFLPASHHILLLETRRSRGPGPDLGRTLETEINAMIQDLSSVLQCGERGMTGHEESNTESSEPLQRRREAWLRERGRSHTRLRSLVDGSAYSRLVEKMIDRQLDADEVALMEAARL